MAEPRAADKSDLTIPADKRRKVRAQFDAEGVTISEWARAHGFNCLTVYRVLAGSVKGKRGESHRIAVALGLKNAPSATRLRPNVTD
ncbi:MAG TPA: DNA-binding protein [Methyloceanibacter sp.]|nr:DNA-binding protein [Methyloceanibacter sp.]